MYTGLSVSDAHTHTCTGGREVTRHHTHFCREPAGPGREPHASTAGPDCAATAPALCNARGSGPSAPLLCHSVPSFPSVAHKAHICHILRLTGRRKPAGKRLNVLAETWFGNNWNISPLRFAGPIRDPSPVKCCC